MSTPQRPRNPSDDRAASTPDDLALRGVIHDVNQMLGVISGRAELLLKRGTAGAGPGQRGDLEAIALAATDAAQMLARLRTRSGVSSLATAVLAEVAEQCTQLIRPPGGAEWATDAASSARTSVAGRWSLQIDIVPALTCAVPPYILREVLNNLLLNALSAMPAGGRLRLTGRQHGQRIELAVQDSGPGVAEDQREAIFAMDVTSSDEAGRGVGLPTCRRLLADWDAELTYVTTNDSSGAFCLDLPLAVAGQPPADRATAADDRNEPTKPVPRGRILVVDDDPATREMLCDVLEDLDQQVTTVKDANEALADFAPGHYEVVFTDLRLPGPSGLELAAELRRRDACLATVLITGWGSDTELAAAEQVDGPIDLVASKPLALGTIEQLLVEGQRLQRGRNDQA